MESAWLYVSIKHMACSMSVRAWTIAHNRIELPVRVDAFSVCQYVKTAANQSIHGKRKKSSFLSPRGSSSIRAHAQSAQAPDDHPLQHSTLAFEPSFSTHQLHFFLFHLSYSSLLPLRPSPQKAFCPVSRAVAVFLLVVVVVVVTRSPVFLLCLIASTPDKIRPALLSAQLRCRYYYCIACCVRCAQSSIAW